MANTCDGCKDYYQDCRLRARLIRNNIKIENCPCSNCIIKPICENICNAFINFGSTSYLPAKDDDEYRRINAALYK